MELELELELGRIQTHMTQKQVLRIGELHGYPQEPHSAVGTRAWSAHSPTTTPFSPHVTPSVPPSQLYKRDCTVRSVTTSTTSKHCPTAPGRSRRAGRDKPLNNMKIKDKNTANFHNSSYLLFIY